LAQLIALYLMSAPNANMIGLYYLPLSTIAHDVGCSVDSAAKALNILRAHSFCIYDHDAELVFVRTMARRQLRIDAGKSLSEGDKRFSMILKILKEINSRMLLLEFYSEYEMPLRLPKLDLDPTPRCPFEGASKSSTSTQEGASDSIPQDQDQEQKYIRQVFAHWQSTMGTKAKLDPKREARIRARLKEGFSPEDLCKAIDGATRDGYLMGTDPKSRRGGYKGIETLLRDAAQVERLMALADGEDDKPYLPEFKPSGNKQLSIDEILEGAPPEAREAIGALLGGNQ
jgi:hypothetical protein